MDEHVEGKSTEISRRSAIKRIGVGAAVVWSAPAIVSVSKAYGQAGSPVDSACADCGDDFCFGQGACGPASECLCSPMPDGTCFCGSTDNGGTCDQYIACDINGNDCPAGTACVPACCFDALGTGVCLAPCGGDSPSPAGGGGGGGAGPTLRP